MQLSLEYGRFPRPQFTFTGFSRRLTVSLLLFSTALLLGACSRDGDPAFDKTIKVNQPDSFASFINPVNSLASGEYVIEVNAENAGDAGEFTLTVTYDDGLSEEFAGSWTSEIGTRKYNIMLLNAGGINISLQSSVKNNIRLKSANGFAVANGAAKGAAMGGNKGIMLNKSRIDSASYGAAYYAAVDPGNKKDTLEKWKVENGFYEALAAGRIIQPRFRDTKDLGYGRGMRMWTKPDGSAYFFVENFQVRSIPGQEYTSLNLDALLADNRKHHFGSNAIEFSTYPYGAGEPGDIGSTHKFAKFYTFDATQGSQTQEDHANETRLDRVNLDGRGMKAMPGACVYCHGGTLRPLRKNAFRGNTYNGSAGNDLSGDTNAKMQLLEVPSFEYGDTSPYTREEQEPIIKQVNMAIYCTYPNLPAEGIQKACAQYCVNPENTANCDGKGTDILSIFSTTTGDGEWTGDFAREMTEGWYDDPGIAGMFDRATFNEKYVPPAWRHDSSDNIPPPGSEQLFLEVVQPVCFVCHSRRGTSLGSVDTRANGKDIDFNSYEKFISHAEQIKQYVYDRGIMPLSLRGYDAFWDEGSSAPEILAAQLNGVLSEEDQIPLNSDKKVDQPGSPIADAGPDRTTTSPVRLFGSNSRFVDRFSWSISSQPENSDAVLTDINTSRPLLTASVDGDYEITLVAAYEKNVVNDVVRIKIDNSLTDVSTPPDPKAITFETHIKPVFSTAGGSDLRECSHCHSVDGGGGTAEPGVPVYWNEIDQTAEEFYDEVLARVNFKDPENSLILKKPGGNHHFGGLRGGFEVDNPSNRHNYDLFLNWILEGAPEN